MVNKKDIVVGIHNAHTTEGGRYNMLGHVNLSYLNTFRKCGVQAYSVKECIKKNIPITFTFGANISGYDYWDNLLKKGIANFSYNVDSLFFKNFKIFEQFSAYPNFILIQLTQNDERAIQNYVPHLKRIYLPAGIDVDFWKKEENCKKEFDVTYMGAMIDIENELEKFKQELPATLHRFADDIWNYAHATPLLPFFDLIEILSKHHGIQLSANDYNYFFCKMIYLIDYSRRVKLIQSIKNTKINLYGGEIWKKYIKDQDNIIFMGESDVLDSVKIVNRSKIVIQTFPMQHCSGLNGRVLMSCAAGTFTLSPNIPQTQQAFGDNLAYYNINTFEDVNEKLNYYLTHDEEREEKANNARKIVLEKYTFQKRLQEFINNIII